MLKLSFHKSGLVVYGKPLVALIFRFEPTFASTVCVAELQGESGTD